MTNDELKELVESHDELILVCQAMMEIVLRAGLHKKLDKKLDESHIQPGFSSRAEEIRQKVSHEYRRAVAGVNSWDS